MKELFPSARVDRFGGSEVYKGTINETTLRVGTVSASYPNFLDFRAQMWRICFWWPFAILPGSLVPRDISLMLFIRRLVRFWTL